jgi:hypothetical protein
MIKYKVGGDHYVLLPTIGIIGFTTSLKENEMDMFVVYWLRNNKKAQWEWTFILLINIIPTQISPHLN